MPTVPNTTSSPRPSIRLNPMPWLRSTRPLSGRWSQRWRRRLKPWSKLKASRSGTPVHIRFGDAGVAHLAERDLPKVEVAGSIPVSRLADFPLSSARRHVGDGGGRCGSSTTAHHSHVSAELASEIYLHHTPRY